MMLGWELDLLGKNDICGGLGCKPNIMEEYKRPVKCTIQIGFHFYIQTGDSIA